MIPLDPMKCDCLGWANTDPTTTFLGNGHNHRCEYFVPNVGALALLTDLVKGIRWWAEQEDGVPEELWEAYSHAVFVTEGLLPAPGTEGGKRA